MNAQKIPRLCGLKIQAITPYSLAWAQQRSLVEDAGERVSSTAVRASLANAELDRAAVLLGRPYAIPGRVVRGKQLGRTLGYPRVFIVCVYFIYYHFIKWTNKGF